MTHSAETDAPCPDCDHIHTPEGCTGPPSPSDLWAGVSVEGCDCIPLEYEFHQCPHEVIRATCGAGGCTCPCDPCAPSRDTPPGGPSCR